jgi:hypothetical protein
VGLPSFNRDSNLEGSMILGATRQRSAGTKFLCLSLDRGYVELCAVMNNPDQDTLIRAVEDARRILGEYIAPGPRDATQTVHRLFAVLDRRDVVVALDRMKRRRAIRLVDLTNDPTR